MNKRIFTCVLSLLVIASCAQQTHDIITDVPDNGNTASISKSLEESTKKIGDTSIDVLRSADEIDIHTDGIKNNISPDVLSKVQPNISGINKETNILREDSKTLSKVEEDLKNAQINLANEEAKSKKFETVVKDLQNSSQKEIDKLRAEVTKLKDENNVLLKKMFGLLAVISTVRTWCSGIFNFLA